MKKSSAFIMVVPGLSANRKSSGNHYSGLYGGRCSYSLFYQPLRKKVERDSFSSVHFPYDDQFRNSKLCLD